MVPEVDLHTFAAAHADGGHVIDVREPYECAAGHVPRARLVPLARLPHHVAELPAAEPVYVICESGNRRWTAAQYVIRRGLDARSVAGGTGVWAASGLPVIWGGQENVA